MVASVSTNAAAGQQKHAAKEEDLFSYQLIMNSVSDEDKIVVQNALRELQDSEWRNVDAFTKQLEDRHETLELLASKLADLSGGQDDEKRQDSIQFLKLLFYDYFVEQEEESVLPDSDISDDDGDGDGDDKPDIYAGKLYTVAHILKIWDTFLLKKYASTEAKETAIYFVEGNKHVSSLFRADDSLDVMHDVAVVTGGNHASESGNILAICGVSEDEEELKPTLDKAVNLIQAYAREKEAQKKGLVQVVFPYKVSGAHWVLGVLNLSDYADSDHLWNGKLTFYDPMNAFVKIPSSVTVEGVRNQDVAEMRKTPVTQQHDLFSSGVIVAENGKDFLDVMENNKESKLRVVYDWGASKLLETQSKEVNITSGMNVLPTNDHEVRESEFKRKVYYAFAKLVTIKKTTDWGPDLETWMGEKAIGITQDSSQLELKDPSDMKMLERIYEEVTSRQIEGVMDQYDSLEDLLFEKTSVKQSDKGLKMQWRMDIMAYLILNDFHMFINIEERKQAEEAETRRLKDLLERYVDGSLEDARIKKEYNEELKGLTDDLGAKNIDAQITELEDQSKKNTKELGEVRKKLKELKNRKESFVELLKDNEDSMKQVNGVSVEQAISQFSSMQLDIIQEAERWATEEKIKREKDSSEKQATRMQEKILKLQEKRKVYQEEINNLNNLIEVEEAKIDKNKTWIQNNQTCLEEKQASDKERHSKNLEDISMQRKDFEAAKKMISPMLDRTGICSDSNKYESLQKQYPDSGHVQTWKCNDEQYYLAKENKNSYTKQCNDEKQNCHKLQGGVNSLRKSYASCHSSITEADYCCRNAENLAPFTILNGIGVCHKCHAQLNFKDHKRRHQLKYAEWQYHLSNKAKFKALWDMQERDLKSSMVKSDQLASNVKSYEEDMKKYADLCNSLGETVRSGIATKLDKAKRKELELMDKIKKIDDEVKAENQYQSNTVESIIKACEKEIIDLEKKIEENNTLLTFNEQKMLEVEGRDNFDNTITAAGEVTQIVQDQTLTGLENDKSSSKTADIEETQNIIAKLYKQKNEVEELLKRTSENESKLMKAKGDFDFQMDNLKKEEKRQNLMSVEDKKKHEEDRVKAQEAVVDIVHKKYLGQLSANMLSNGFLLQGGPSLGGKSPVANLVKCLMLFIYQWSDHFNLQTEAVSHFTDLHPDVESVPGFKSTFNRILNELPDFYKVETNLSQTIVDVIIYKVGKVFKDDLVDLKLKELNAVLWTSIDVGTALPSPDCLILYECMGNFLIVEDTKSSSLDRKTKVEVIHLITSTLLVKDHMSTLIYAISEHHLKDSMQSSNVEKLTHFIREIKVQLKSPCTLDSFMAFFGEIVSTKSTGASIQRRLIKSLISIGQEILSNSDEETRASFQSCLDVIVDNILLDLGTEIQAEIGRRMKTVNNNSSSLADSQINAINKEIENYANDIKENEVTIDKIRKDLEINQKSVANVRSMTKSKTDDVQMKIAGLTAKIHIKQQELEEVEVHNSDGSIDTTVGDLTKEIAELEERKKHLMEEEQEGRRVLGNVTKQIQLIQASSERAQKKKGKIESWKNAKEVQVNDLVQWRSLMDKFYETLTVHPVIIAQKKEISDYLDKISPNEIFELLKTFFSNSDTMLANETRFLAESSINYWEAKDTGFFKYDLYKVCENVMRVTLIKDTSDLMYSNYTVESLSLSWNQVKEKLAADVCTRLSKLDLKWGDNSCLEIDIAFQGFWDTMKRDCPLLETLLKDRFKLFYISTNMKGPTKPDWKEYDEIDPEKLKENFKKVMSDDDFKVNKIDVLRCFARKISLISPNSIVIDSDVELPGIELEVHSNNTICFSKDIEMNTSGSASKYFKSSKARDGDDKAYSAWTQRDGRDGDDGVCGMAGMNAGHMFLQGGNFDGVNLIRSLKANGSSGVKGQEGGNGAKGNEGVTSLKAVPTPVGKFGTASYRLAWAFYPGLTKDNEQDPHKTNELSGKGGDGGIPGSSGQSGSGGLITFRTIDEGVVLRKPPMELELIEKAEVSSKDGWEPLASKIINSKGIKTPHLQDQHDFKHAEGGESGEPGTAGPMVELRRTGFYRNIFSESATRREGYYQKIEGGLNHLSLLDMAVSPAIFLAPIVVRYDDGFKNNDDGDFRGQIRIIGSCPPEAKDLKGDGIKTEHTHQRSRKNHGLRGDQINRQNTQVKAEEVVNALDTEANALLLQSRAMEIASDKVYSNMMQKYDKENAKLSSAIEHLSEEYSSLASDVEQSQKELNQYKSDQVAKEKALQKVSMALKEVNEGIAQRRENRTELVKQSVNEIKSIMAQENLMVELNLAIDYTSIEKMSQDDALAQLNTLEGNVLRAITRANSILTAKEKSERNSIEKAQSSINQLKTQYNMLLPSGLSDRATQEKLVNKYQQLRALSNDLQNSATEQKQSQMQARVQADGSKFLEEIEDSTHDKEALLWGINEREFFNLDSSTNNSERKKDSNHNAFYVNVALQDKETIKYVEENIQRMVMLVKEKGSFDNVQNGCLELLEILVRYGCYTGGLVEIINEIDDSKKDVNISISDKMETLWPEIRSDRKFAARQQSYERIEEKYVHPFDSRRCGLYIHYDTVSNDGLTSAPGLELSLRDLQKKVNGNGTMSISTQLLPVVQEYAVRARAIWNLESLPVNGILSLILGRVDMFKLDVMSILEFWSRRAIQGELQMNKQMCTNILNILITINGTFSAKELARFNERTRTLVNLLAGKSTDDESLMKIQDPSGMKPVVDILRQIINQKADQSAQSANLNRTSISRYMDEMDDAIITSNTSISIDNLEELAESQAWSIIHSIDASVTASFINFSHTVTDKCIEGFTDIVELEATNAIRGALRAREDEKGLSVATIMIRKLAFFKQLSSNIESCDKGALLALNKVLHVVGSSSQPYQGEEKSSDAQKCTLHEKIYSSGIVNDIFVEGEKVHLNPTLKYEDYYELLTFALASRMVSFYGKQPTEAITNDCKHCITLLREELLKIEGTVGDGSLSMRGNGMENGGQSFVPPHSAGETQNE